MSLLLRCILPLALCLSTTTYACDFCDNPISFALDGAFGAANYANTFNHDGQTAVGRLSFGLMLKQENLAFGIDGGLQTGNTMRLNFPKEDIFILGGVPIQAQVKPLIDVLLTFHMNLMEDIWFGFLKGGVAYRQMQIDRESVNDLSGFAPEMQAGLGYRLNEQASINLTYQYIWGRTPILKVDALEETGFLRNIPAQQALMLGFSYNF